MGGGLICDNIYIFMTIDNHMMIPIESVIEKRLKISQ